MRLSRAALSASCLHALLFYFIFLRESCPMQTNRGAPKRCASREQLSAKYIKGTEIIFPNFLLPFSTALSTEEYMRAANPHSCA